MKSYPEFEEQKALFEWWGHYSKNTPFFMFSIANERKVPLRTMVRLKSTGLVSGIPDVFLAHARLGYHGLFIEMKAPKGRVSDNQKEAMRRLSESKYACAVCYGADEAIKLIRAYLLGNGDGFEELLYAQL